MLKSFRSGVFSVVHLLFVLIVLSSGIFLLLGSLLINMQNMAIHWLLEYPNLIRSVGLFVFLSGIVLFFGFYLMYKGRYYKIEMQCAEALVEETIIQDYVKKYWKELFPDVRLEVIIHPKQTIEIITKLPKTAIDFSRIQNELGTLLARKLGYKKAFTLTIVS